MERLFNEFAIHLGISDLIDPLTVMS